MDDAATRSAPLIDGLPAPRSFHAGPLTALLDGGDLRYLRLGGVEVLRRLFVGVRDDAWGTVPGVVSRLEVDQGASGFRVGFEAEHRRGEIAFRWRGTIEGRAPDDGRTIEVRYAMDGRAESTFSTNRVGLVVLHPIRHAAGRPARVEHADGSVTRSEFPRLVTPDSPFTDIRALTHEPVDGLTVEVRFEGDVFEAEDQRNWADGSFKTYNRPLSWPYPYTLEAGQEVRQAATVRITDTRPERPEALAGEAIRVRMGEPVGRLPAIGLRFDPLSPAPSDDQRALLRRLNLAHLRADLDGRAIFAPEAYRALARISVDLGSPVELALHLPDPDEADPALRQAAEAAGATGLSVVRWLVYAEGRKMVPVALVARAREILLRHDPAAIIGGGTIGNFAELNRDRPPPGELDALAYPICPQIHATDNLSLIENLEALGDAVATARSFADGAAVAVGPVRFHRHPDPFAGGNAGEGREPVRPDPRQAAPIGAAWTLGALARLAEAGADSVTLYDAVGPFGVMDDSGAFPAYHVLAALADVTGAGVLRVEVEEPLRVAGLALCPEDGPRRLLLANLTPETQALHLKGLPSSRADTGGSVRLDLRPWEVARFEEGGGP